MYPIEILWNNKRAVANLQKLIIERMKAKYKMELTASAAEENSDKTHGEVNPFCGLRFTCSKSSVLYLVGFSQAGQYEAFTGIAGAGKSPEEMGELAKDLEKEFTKIIFDSIEPELTDKQLKADANSMLCVPQKSLGGWATISVDKVLTLKFTGGGAEFSFAFPIYDKKFYDMKTSEIFGFPGSARMLVVDDSATSRKLSRFALNLAGYTNVDECPDGDAAFTKMLSSSPAFDLLVADWHMPNLSGLDLLRKVRADKEIKATPVILVTGEQNAQEVTTAIKEGVNGYVVKPFQPDTLYKMLKKSSAVVAQKKAA